MNTILRKFILLWALFLGAITQLQAAQFPIVLEAENAKLFGELKVETVSGFSGNKYVHDFHINSDSYYLYENVEVDQAGTYEFKVFSTGTARPFYIKVNDYERTVLRTGDSPDWNAPPTTVASTYIYLDAGVNTIKMGTEFENGPNVDKFEIHRTSMKINQPEKVSVLFPYDFTDEAVITAEHTNETLPYLTDNNENTYYEVTGTEQTTITVDCQESKVLTGMLLYAGRGVDVTQWTVEYSKDGQRWTQLRPSSTRMIGMGDMALFSYDRVVTSSTYSARYYRLTATGTDRIRIAEWQLFGYAFNTATNRPLFPVDVTEGTNPEQQVTGYPEGSANEGIMKLFDKQLTTKYCVSGTSFYVQYVLDKAYKFDSYTVISANDASERDPKLWSLSGYNPEEGWIELDEQRDFVFPGRYTTQKFRIDSDKEFTAFMLEVSSVHAGTMVQLASLQVFGEPTGNPAVSPEVPSNPSGDPKERASELVRLMTKSEKLAYVGGVDWMYTRSVPRLGIPQMKMSDGPQGVGTWGNSTAYPCDLCLAATWNENLAHSYGEALASDCRAYGVNILLGPAVNIHRAPMCGRNFEYMGEDPYLTSRTAVGYIKGLQENGVMAVIKHFVANFQEYDRNYISSDIDERTLNEIYFPSFRAAVQEAKVGSVMSSYNLLNGTWTTHHPWLLRTVLRDQWGFDGILMSDWGSTHYCLPAALGGLDLEMAGGEKMNPDSLRYFIDRGDLDMSVIDEKVQHILQTMIKFGFMDNEQLDSSIPKDNPASAETALKVAREGMVLLKNENRLLPLKADKIRTVAVVGQNALRYLTGGGSGRVTPNHYVSFYDGIRAIGAQKGIEVKYVDEYDHLDDNVYVASGSDEHGFKGEYFNNTDLNGTPATTRTDANINFNFQNGTGVDGIGTSNYSIRWTAELRPTEDGTYIFHLGGDDGFRLYIDGQRVINNWNPGQERYSTYQMSLSAEKKYSIKVEYYQGTGAAVVDFYWTKVGSGDYFQEKLNDADVVVACFGHDSSTEAEAGDRTFELPSKQKELISKVLSSTTTPVVGVVTAGGNVEMQSWVNRLKGLLWAWYAGQEAGTALGEILFGDVNPSGKLPVTFEKRWADNPTYRSYYDSDNDKHVEFTEGIFMGYRGYDKSGQTVQYPFGYGLSYTTFNLSQMTVEPATGTDAALVKAVCELKNTGDVAGAQVVQLYVGKKGMSKVERPLKELKAYQKVYLAPGESKKVVFYLKEDAFSYYDVDATSFVLDEGDYDISIGFSSAELPLKEEITIKGATGIESIVSGSKMILIPTVVESGESVAISSGVASKVDIFNTSGILKASFCDTDHIPTVGLSRGMYLVRMNIGVNHTNGKFIVK
ncbi:glycoside hydrolase family 3 C-terminal domain-containing protein [Bacteroides sp.]